RPFFAFRDKHALSKANMVADGRSYPIPGGVKCRLYPEFPWLHLQIDKDTAEFIPAPDWYYNFEYPQELQRGYEGHEDLLTTGYFEMELKKGESIVFSASVEQMHSPSEIDDLFATSIAARTHKIDFLSCLRHSARQFMVRRAGNRTEVIAGFPWVGIDPRQELIALPGITLTQDGLEDCINDLDMFVREMEGGMFVGAASAYENVDTPLWFFWVLQQLERHLGAEQIWEQYGQTMKTLLETYRRGMGDRVALHDNGLIWASEYNVPLTWMNTVVEGQAVTPRSGYQVEVNALWYNAVCYTVELAARFGDKSFVKAWKTLP
ncbi:MAG: amylo-alpha-1,6-glucosidase, partial [Alistipes sp.]